MVKNVAKSGYMGNVGIYYYYYYYSTMALANKDDPISNGVVYCYEVSVDLGALNRSRWRRE